MASPAHGFPSAEESRLQEVQAVAEDHHNLGTNRPPAEVGQERHQREGQVGKPYLVLELWLGRRPPEALSIAVVEEEVPEEGQQPDEADGGRSNDFQSGEGVR